MKKLVLSTLMVFLLASCSSKDDIEKTIDAIEVDVTIERFDKEFFETSDARLSDLKEKYPHLFPAYVPDSIWLEQKNDTIYREIYREIHKQFPDTDQLKKELTSLFQHIKYYFPKQRIPKVNTVVAEVDYNSKVFFTDSIAIISLDLYLGKDHHFYERDAYLREELEPSQIMPDLVKSFAEKRIPYPNNGEFLSRIVYEGKILYLKDLLIPAFSDEDKINYTAEKLAWAKENEENVWRYFIDENALYSTDPSLVTRFVNIAPFSKFYLDIDNESPGKMGSWMGWQIVRAYAKNNPQVTIDELLRKSADEIFKQSKYKPNR
ncbi:MAG TPA: gliding motility lipoprotein GldB [Flavobacterium sp.]|nr:gliding motility lipoprotein GldB [Flavobacterium sp.]